MSVPTVKVEKHMKTSHHHLRRSRWLQLPATVVLASAVFASDTVSKDLQAVIALQGKPCGEVQDTEKKGDNDYIASCSNGKRYRVSMNASGRVDVKEQ
ncbi:MAG: hypothetical protein CMQ61_09150 [Gammaproteobacteria bacterium]|nr:hypothetical protein [Gammaproteobacteria bacterium]